MIVSPEDRLVHGSQPQDIWVHSPGTAFGYSFSRTEEVKDSVPKTTLTSDTHFFQCLGVPKTTIRFDNLLEKLRGLIESCYTHGCGLRQHRDAGTNQPGEEMHAGI